MAQKPDGKPAGTQRVTFTKPAAERIARVVREVEGGDRDGAPLTFGARVGEANAKVFRVCTFTGAWSIGASKTVAFRGVTTTPNTVAAQNIFVSLPDRGTANCGIAKDGTAWHLVAWSPMTATASVLTSVSLGTSGLQFNTMTIRFSETVSTSVTTIGTTACS